MKNLNILLISIICLTSCNYLKNVNLLTSGDLERGNFTDSIPFRYEKDLIIVQAQINGKQQPLDFIFDTGAFNSKINHTLTDEYDLETKAIKENKDTHGNVKTIEVTQLEQVKFGETVFTKIGAGKVVYAEDSPSPCIAEHGIIGANLIKLAHWKIDYAKQMIYFSDEPFALDNPSEAINFKYNAPMLSATPKVDFLIDGRKVENLLIDTGSNGGFRLPSSIGNAFSSKETETYFDRSVSGIYGFKTDTLVVKNLYLDDFDTVFPVQFSVLGKGLIGNEFLKHFKLYINPSDDVIILEPQTPIVQPQKQQLSVVPSEENTWIINRVSVNATHGLNLGDTVLKVNNKTPADLYKNYCEYVMKNREIYVNQPIVITTIHQDTLTIFTSK